MKKPKISRWLIFVLVFVIFMIFWGTLAAAAPPSVNVQAPTPTPIEGMIDPGSASSSIIIGAILMVAIVVTGTILRKINRS